MPNGGPEFLAYFLPAELTVLLRPVRAELVATLRQPRLPEEWPPLDAGTLAALDVVLKDLPPELKQGHDIRLHPDTPLEGPDGQPRRLLPMQRGGDDRPLVLQTVNLRSWTPDLRTARTKQALRRPLAEAGIAAGGVNTILGDPPTPINLGDYELVAATPNWLAAPG
jgi:hypothetical protein